MLPGLYFLGEGIVVSADFNIMEAINNHIKCVDVTMHTWSGRRRLRDATVQLGDQQVDKNKVTAPQSKLMPTAWAKKIQEIQSAKSRLVNQHSMPHMASGWAAVRSNKLGKFVEELARLRQALHVIRDDLVANYQTELYEWNRAEWGPLFDDHFSNGKLVPGVSAQLPTADELRDAIDLTWIVMDVRPGSIELQGADAEHVAALQEMTRTMMQQQVNDFITQLLRGPREQLKDSVEKLASTLSDMQQVTPNTFNAIRNAVGLLKEFHDLPSLSDDVLLAKISRMEEQINSLKPGYSGGVQLKSLQVTPEIGRSLITAMNDVAAACLDEVAMQDLQTRFLAQTGKHRRVLR